VKALKEFKELPLRSSYASRKQPPWGNPKSTSKPTLKRSPSITANEGPPSSRLRTDTNNDPEIPDHIQEKLRTLEEENSSLRMQVHEMSERIDAITEAVREYDQELSEWEDNERHTHLFREISRLGLQDPDMDTILIRPQPCSRTYHPRPVLDITRIRGHDHNEE